MSGYMLNTLNEDNEVNPYLQKLAESKNPLAKNFNTKQALDKYNARAQEFELRRKQIQMKISAPNLTKFKENSKLNYSVRYNV